MIVSNHVLCGRRSGKLKTLDKAERIDRTGAMTGVSSPKRLRMRIFLLVEASTVDCVSIRQRESSRSPLEE